jgi:hypothetical protein
MTTSRPRGMFPPEYPFPERQPGSATPEVKLPPVPVIYEESELEGMSLRVYAAIHLRVPESGIGWLDKMIQRSRQLDRKPR